MYNANEQIPNGMTLGRAEPQTEDWRCLRCGEIAAECEECEKVFCQTSNCRNSPYLDMNAYEDELLTAMGACSHRCAMRIWTRTKARAEGRKA